MLKVIGKVVRDVLQLSHIVSNVFLNNSVLLVRVAMELIRLEDVEFVRI